MKPILLLLLLSLTASVCAQRVVTLDPQKDVLANRQPDGSIQIIIPTRALSVSIQEAMPTISSLEISGIQKIGKSNYIIASGKVSAQPEAIVVLAMLLVETTPGYFQADGLIISCSSTGNCRECTLPPLCKCSKGEGSCVQNTILVDTLKKVTVTLFE